MHAIRMLEDRDGSPNGHTVYTYHSGEIYTRESEPPVSDSLMTGFVASGHAIEVDAQGNPVGTPAEARAKKQAWEAQVAALTTPDADTDEGANSPMEQKLRRSR